MRGHGPWVAEFKHYRPAGAQLSMAVVGYNEGPWLVKVEEIGRRTYRATIPATGVRLVSSRLPIERFKQYVENLFLEKITDWVER